MSYKRNGRLARVLHRATLILLPPEDTGLPDEMDRLVKMRNRQVAGMLGIPESQPIQKGHGADSDIERLVVSLRSESMMREADLGLVVKSGMSQFRFVEVSGVSVAVIKREVGKSFESELRSTVGFVMGESFLSGPVVLKELVDKLGQEDAVRLCALLRHLEFPAP